MFGSFADLQAGRLLPLPVWRARGGLVRCSRHPQRPVPAVHAEAATGVRRMDGAQDGLLNTAAIKRSHCMLRYERRMIATLWR